MTPEAFFAVTALLPLVAQVDDMAHHGHHMEAAHVGSAGDSPIRITINPEARIIAVLDGSLPRPAPCGVASDLPVKVLNQGRVTARLEAQFIGEAPSGVTLDFHPEPLTGRAEEVLQLRITLTSPGPVDLTIGFRAKHEMPDFGGLDRVHFLMRCLASEP